MEYYTMTTDAGDQSIAKAIQTGTTTTFKQIAVGDGSGAYYEPAKTQTALRREVWRGDAVVTRDPNNAKRDIITATIPATAGGFTIREAGIFDSENVLMVISKLPLSEKVAPESGASSDMVIRLYVEVSDTNAVTVTVDPSAITATQADVQKAKADVKADLTAHTEDTVAHMTKEQKDQLASCIQSATINGTAVPKNGTMLQFPALAVKSDTVTATVPASAWSGADAPYSATVSVTGAKPEPTRIEVQPTKDATAEQWAAWRAALIRGGGQDTDKITLLADGDKPTIDIPITATIRGDVQ